MTSLDIESIEHLDFAHIEKCNSVSGYFALDGTFDTTRQDCPNEAKYRVFLKRCCNLTDYERIRLWCQNCLDKKMKADCVGCKACGMIWIPASTAYERVEPL